MTLAIQKLQAPGFIHQAHAEKFQQGGRSVYSFTLDLVSLNRILPVRVNETITKDANRPLYPAHAKEIAEYLLSRTDWLLGTILLGIDAGSVKFNAYTGPESETVIGLLTILAGLTGQPQIHIFDGQHRRKAIEDLLALIFAKNGSTIPHPRAEELLSARIPVLLYVEDDIIKLRQMFNEHGKAKTPEAFTKTRFDHRDPFDRTAVWLAGDDDEGIDANSSLFRNRVDMNHSTVSRRSPTLISINQLSRAVKYAEMGYSRRLSKDAADEYLQDLDDLHAKSLIWADEFLPAARPEYADLFDGTHTSADIPAMRPYSLAYNATVIQLFAACYQLWTTTIDEDWKPLAEFLSSASLKPKQWPDDKALLVDAGIVPAGGLTPLPRSQEFRKAINIIVGLAAAANA